MDRILMIIIIFFTLVSYNIVTIEGFGSWFSLLNGDDIETKKDDLTDYKEEYAVRASNDIYNRGVFDDKYLLVSKHSVRDELLLD